MVSALSTLTGCAGLGSTEAWVQDAASGFLGAGFVTAVLLLVTAHFLLPRQDRQRLRLSTLLIFVYLLLSAIALLLEPSTPDGAEKLRLAALFLVLVSAGRSGFLLILHSYVSRRLARPLPKIIWDIVQGTIYGVALLFTLQAAGLEPSFLLTSSALLTAVVGLSLQDTLGNLFAGLAIQAQHPFEVGDWIQYDTLNENIGIVVEINWRAVRVRTLEHIEITVPNNLLARAPIRNFTRPQVEARQQVQCVAPYATPPRQVMALLLRAVRDVPGVLSEPAPSVVPRDFTDRGVSYDVRYFITDFQRRDLIEGHVRERIWYALNRAELEIPVPRRSIVLHEKSAQADEEREHRLAEARGRYLKRVDFLDGLPEEALRTLARMSETRLYDRDEAIIEQGDEDEEFFIVQTGRVAIEVHKPGQGNLLVATLGPGQFFGEMSLMTGERRRATVRSVDEVQLLAVGKQAFHKIFDDRPELVARISEVLAKRQEQLGEIESRSSEEIEQSERSAELLERIRSFFSL